MDDEIQSRGTVSDDGAGLGGADAATQDESGATSGMGEDFAVSQAGTMVPHLGRDDDDDSLLHAEDGAGVGDGREGELGG